MMVGLGAMLMFYGPTDNWSWDPSYYYAQLRSPIIDHDLDFRDETVTNGVVTKVTVTGLQGSPWPLGPSILWSPFFLAAHFLVQLISPIKANGFTFPYIAFVSFGSSLYGIAGLFLLYRLCRDFGNRFISTITVLLCLGATPLFYYIFRQPIMAHSTGFLIATLTLLFYIRLVERQMYRNQSGFIFGVLLGLGFLMRWTGILFAIFPIFHFTGEIVKAIRVKNFQEVRFLLKQILVMSLSFILTISPQLALWYRLYGTFLTVPQGSSSFVGNFFPINIWKIFLDTNRGIVFWSPIVVIGMLGMALIPNRNLKISTATCMLSQIILIGYRVDWFSGGGFGARYFIELLPVLAVGFVFLGREISEKSRGKVFLTIFTLSLIFHQAVLMHTVEHAVDGWLNLTDYLKGNPLGLSWQVKSFLRLIKEPVLWFAPRPFVAQERQTILVNFLGQAQDLRTYRITGIATGLMPVAILLSRGFQEYLTRVNYSLLLSGVVLYMMAWAFFLMLVN
jgi:hypothetical protein